MAKRMSRRTLIEGAAVIGGAITGGWARTAAAVDQDTAEKDKISHAEAQYQPQPKGQQRCDICLQFLKPNKCRIVQSPINPKGWCQFFAAQENAH
jgi:hypothetical protein